VIFPSSGGSFASISCFLLSEFDELLTRFPDAELDLDRLLLSSDGGFFGLLLRFARSHRTSIFALGPMVIEFEFTCVVLDDQRLSEGLRNKLESVDSLMTLLLCDPEGDVFVIQFVGVLNRLLDVGEAGSHLLLNFLRDLDVHVCWDGRVGILGMFKPRGGHDEQGLRYGNGFAGKVGGILKDNKNGGGLERFQDSHQWVDIRQMSFMSAEV
jgi:hypothetical protein